MTDALERARTLAVGGGVLFLRMDAPELSYLS
jgi:hypothetical protein